MKPNIFLICLFSLLSCGKGEKKTEIKNYNPTYYKSDTFQAEDLKYDFKIPKARKYYEEGRKFYLQKEFAKSIDSYKKSLQIEKKSGTYNELGITYRVIKDYPNSINSFEEGIENSKNSWSLYFNLANTYSAMGDYENSKKYLEQIITKTDSEFWKEYSYLHLSAIYYNDHDIVKAKEFLKKPKKIEENEEFKELFNSIKDRIESY